MFTKDELHKTINRIQLMGYLSFQSSGLQHIQIFNSLWKASRFGYMISQRLLVILFFFWKGCVIMGSGAEPTCLLSGNPNSYQRTMPYHQKPFQEKAVLEKEETETGKEHLQPSCFVLDGICFSSQLK